MKISNFLLLVALLSTPARAADESSRPIAADVGVDRQAAPLSAERGKPELLTNEDLAELSRRAETPGRDVAGGALTNQQLTYIVIALAAAVLVLVLK
ncbi:MAG TPA: hypothetical protein VFL57_19425 [Bryobacteraceae bacterium]|nr:hypothetical protein [Bryobacteraceae bacterium]